MPTTRRTDRLNSLLKEVLSEVIRKDVRNPKVHEFVSISKVDITKDLHYAKVYISVIAEESEKQETLKALQSAAGFIGCIASKKVVMRYFPHLTFIIDDSVEKHMRINSLLEQIKIEKDNRDNDY